MVRGDAPTAAGGPDSGFGVADRPKPTFRLHPPALHDLLSSADGIVTVGLQSERLQDGSGRVAAVRALSPHHRHCPVGSEGLEPPQHFGVRMELGWCSSMCAPAPPAVESFELGGVAGNPENV